MIFHILDRQFNTLATMDNSLTGAIHFFDDEFHLYLQESSATFHFTALKNNEDYVTLVEGNYISFNYHYRDYLMVIQSVSENEWHVEVEADDLSLDLINEQAGEFTATKEMKITEYLSMWGLQDSDVVIGINEVYNAKRTLSWTGESSVLARILSLANYFDAEVEFVTELNADRSLKQITLNIYHKYDDTHQGVGVDRTDIELRLGENVSTVKRTTDITELYTAIRPTGNDGLTVKSIEETIKDDDGNILYYTPKNSEYIYAPVANERFGRQNAKSGGYILMPYSYDTDSVATLYGNALSQLKKYSEPAVTYEVEGYYDLNVGDVVSIADNRYTPTLLLEARVSEMVISFTQPESNKTIFSNYRVFESQVDSDLLKLMEDMRSDVDYAMQVAKTPIFKIITLGSTVFKNGDGEVELSAAVERANTDVTSEYSVFNWVKEFKLGGIDEEWTAAHVNFGKSVTITPADFDDAAVFYYEAEGADGTLHTGGSASLVKVYDGEDGQTPVKGVDYFDGEDGTNGTSAYLHVRYSQNADGNPMTTDPTDAKYLGLQASQNPNASTVPADYDWSLVKGPQGIPGEAVDGKTSYLHIKYSDDGGKTFTGNTGEDSGAYLGQYVDFEPADSTDVTKYAWSKIKGEDGADGKDGVAGKDGVGLKATAIQYAQSTSGTTAPTTGWANSVPTLVKGQYLWTKTVWTYTDNSSETGYTVSYNAKDGNTGKDGIAGKDGVGISNTVIEYVGAVSGTSKPTSGWSTTIPTVPAGQYLWTRTTWTYTDGTKEQGYSTALMGPKGDKGDTGAKGADGKDGAQGVPGEKGADGKTSYLHTAWKMADGTFTVSYPQENLFSETVGMTYKPHPLNTTIVYVPVPATVGKKYTAQSNRAYSGTTTSVWFINNIDALPASNVNGIGMQGTTPITRTVTATTNFVYLVFRTVSVLSEFLNGSKPSKAKVEQGDTTTVYTEAPSDDYSLAYPKYRGEYTDFTAADSTNPADYTWTAYLGQSGQDGKDGIAGADGKGIKSTAVTYQASASGTVAPTGTWVANPPTVAKGQYLWTRTIWTYTDNATETGYSVAYVAKDGNNGSDGIAGKDGVGIKSTAITYAVSSSGTTAPTSGWTASPPTATEGQFMWTKTVWTYTDNTTETGYSVGKIGNTGPKGDTGATGATGNGIASTAVTYQASSNGTTAPTGTWSTTIPSVAANQYLWTRTVISYTNNTSSTAYSVGKMGANGATGPAGTPGKDGSNGANGVSVTSVVEEYYISTSPDSQAGGSWSTTVPNNADPNKYIWRRMKNTFSDGTVTYTNPALIQGMTGIYPYIGPTQPANPKEGQQWWKSDSSGNVTNFYVYKNGSWQGQTIQQSILNIVALNAVTITGSTITGTNINGSVFTNTFTIDLGVSDTGTGTTVIRDGALKMDMAVKDSSGAAAYTQGHELSPLNGLYMWQKLQGATQADYARLGPAGLELYLPSLGFSGTLTAQALTNMPWTNLTYASGWTTAEDNPCQYKIVYNLDGTKTIKFRGQFKPTSGTITSATAYPFGMLTLPTAIRPNRTEFAQGSTNKFGGGRLAVTTTGSFLFNSYDGGDAYCAISPMSYIIE